MAVPPSAHSVPASHAMDLAKVVKLLGISEDRLFDGMGLSRPALQQPDARISLAVGERLVARAIELTGQPGLGIMLGFRMRVPAHGYLGFAAMTAPTVRHAIDLAVRYAPTRTTALAFRLEERESDAAFYIEERCDLGAARLTVLFALAVGMWRMGESLTGKQLVGTAEFAFPEPSFAPQVVGSPVTAQYGKPANCLRFQRSYLDLRLVLAEPTASQLAQEQCERELEALDRAGLEARVREVLPRAGGGVRSADEVATALGISSRTLHRKLKAEGVTFSEIADTWQHRQACVLLRDDKLSIDQVAERVGYSDVSNFNRAFRRWTGLTPAAFRKTGR
ncbi:MAG: AraC family transcriptional regulator [Myxococcales bacterium]